MRRMVADKQPTYMQLIRAAMGKVFDDSADFDPNRAKVLREGKDVTLVSTGLMTQYTVKVAGELADEGVGVDLLHYPSVKPFDADTLVASARKTGGVVTVENQSILGGLGGAVCEVLCEQCPVPVKRLGVPDQFGEVASANYLLSKHRFGPEHIAEACRELARR